MARRYRRRFLGRGNRRRPHWSSAQFSAAINSGLLPDLNPMVIVAVGDYQGNPQMSPNGVTILRCILNMCFYLNDFAAASERACVYIRWGLAICDKDVDTAFPDPSDSQSLTDERWLQVGSLVLQAETTTAAGSLYKDNKCLALDIKQKARLHDTELLLCIGASNIVTPAGDWTLGYQVQSRTLLVGEVT